VVLDTVPLGLRHWLVLACVVLLCLVACLRVVLEQEDVRPWGNIAALANGPTDDWARAVGRIAAVGNQRTDVIILGTSLARESLWRANEIAAAVEAAGGQPLKVLNLLLSDLTFREALFLVEQLHLGPGQRVLLFHSPTSFAQTERARERLRRGLFLSSPLGFARRFQDELPELRGWLEPLAAARTRITLARGLFYRSVHNRIQYWATRRLYGQPTFTRYRYGHLEADRAAHARIQPAAETGIRHRMREHWETTHATEARDARAFLTYVASTGARAYLFDSPLATGDDDRLFAPWWTEYQRLVERIATATDTERVDLNQSVPIGVEDYTYGRHVGRAARARWSRALVAWLASGSGAP
jgi:hypothetical protein